MESSGMSRSIDKYFLEPLNLGFYYFKKAKVVIENQRKEYNTVRPHRSLDYRPPTPEAIQPLTFELFWFRLYRKNRKIYPGFLERERVFFRRNNVKRSNEYERIEEGDDGSIRPVGCL